MATSLEISGWDEGPGMRDAGGAHGQGLRDSVLLGPVSQFWDQPRGFTHSGRRRLSDAFHMGWQLVPRGYS